MHISNLAQFEDQKPFFFFFFDFLSSICVPPHTFDVMVTSHILVLVGCEGAWLMVQVFRKELHTHTHTHTHIYIYIYIYFRLNYIRILSQRKEKKKFFF